MSKRPTKPPKSPSISDEIADFPATDLTDDASDDNLSDDFDLLDAFDPDSDASYWDPGEIDLDEPEFDQRDFCLEDEADDDG